MARAANGERNPTLEEMNEFRKRNGLKPIVPTKITCKMCGNEFESVNKRSNKYCSRCKASKAYRRCNGIAI